MPGAKEPNVPRIPIRGSYIVVPGRVRIRIEDSRTFATGEEEEASPFLAVAIYFQNVVTVSLP